MKRYSEKIKSEISNLRRKGLTYSEIVKLIGIKIPKSTLSGWVHNISLPPEYEEKISKLNTSALDRGRKKAVIVNQIKREKFFSDLINKNQPVAENIRDKNTAKIALAMLCLGEAAKYSSGGGRFSLGSSDPKIIVTLLELLKKCFHIDEKKYRATVQCRADQNTGELNSFWQKITGIPPNQFYKPNIDPRTKGKPTQKTDYKGVLRIDYFDTKVQLELESLADLIYNNLLGNAGVYPKNLLTNFQGPSYTGSTELWHSSKGGSIPPGSTFHPKYQPVSSSIIKVVVFSIIDGNLRIFLKNRKLISTPLTGDKKLDEIAQNSFEEELNIRLGNKYQEQLYTLSQKNQIRIIYYVLVPECEILNGLLSNFHEASEVSDSTDKEIISYAVQRLRWKIEYTNAVYSLLPVEFTFSNLQNVYEAILGETLDKRNFRKKILSLNIIKPTGHVLSNVRARPAEMFKFRQKKLTFVKIL